MTAFRLPCFVIPAKAGTHSGEPTDRPDDTFVRRTGSRIGLRPSGMTDVRRER
jgi:hypothetical protein